MTDPTPDLLRLAVRMTHNSDCAAPKTIQIRGTKGDHGLLCRACRATWFPPPGLIATTLGAYESTREQPTLASELRVPGAPTPRSAGWPTHKARARSRRR
ncbi:hypothetical protein [Nocardioides okcheonensis]|uniref:hypothetical protein n=1 Tax=Nocardioides okcheonensis TaxID=2894081 RepID=UPI001E58DB00|nr:hypothetical protein [Nocardioides okcheonensis]UFN46078.1 hypothetical protein LN652_07720 [Nocardioides okcheonensis]